MSSLNSTNKQQSIKTAKSSLVSLTQLTESISNMKHDYSDSKIVFASSYHSTDMIGSRLAYDQFLQDMSSEIYEQTLDVVTCGNQRATAFSTQRLMRDYHEVLSNKLETVCGRPLEHNLYEWHVNIIATRDSPYYGAIFHLVMHFGHDYPYSPPKIILKSHATRPNLIENDVCLYNISQKWSPQFTALSILIQLQTFLLDIPHEISARTIADDCIRSLLSKQCKCGHNPLAGHTWPKESNWQDVSSIQIHEKFSLHASPTALTSLQNRLQKKIKSKLLVKQQRTSNKKPKFLLDLLSDDEILHIIEFMLINDLEAIAAQGSRYRSLTRREHILVKSDLVCSISKRTFQETFIGITFIPHRNNLYQVGFNTVDVGVATECIESDDTSSAMSFFPFYINAKYFAAVNYRVTTTEACEIMRTLVATSAKCVSRDELRRVLELYRHVHRYLIQMHLHKIVVVPKFEILGLQLQHSSVTISGSGHSSKDIAQSLTKYLALMLHEPSRLKLFKFLVLHLFFLRYVGLGVDSSETDLNDVAREYDLRYCKPTEELVNQMWVRIEQLRQFSTCEEIAKYIGVQLYELKPDAFNGKVSLSILQIAVDLNFIGNSLDRKELVPKQVTAEKKATHKKYHVPTRKKMADSKKIAFSYDVLHELND